MNKIAQSKKILQSIQNIVESCKGKDFDCQEIQDLKEISKPIRNFFNVNHEQAIILSLYLDAGFSDTDLDTNKIITFFGKKIAILSKVNLLTNELLTKKLLIPRRYDYPSRRKSYLNKSFQIKPRVMEAVLKGDKNHVKHCEAITFFELLNQVRDLILKRIDKEISTTDMADEVYSILEENKTLSEVKWLLSHTELSKCEFVLVLDMAIEHLEGVEDVDIEKLIKEVYSDIPDRVKYKRKIKDGNSALINSNIFVSAESFFDLFNFMRLSDEAMDILLGGADLHSSVVYKPKMGEVLQSEKIQVESLYYNDEERAQIEILTDALKEENFKTLTAKLEANAMNKGVTVLFYGSPGTGKTSSVKQIARITGRSIFMVEIQKLQSKWLGESEKNIALIFEEYKRLKKTLDRVPILLFNEADAILGKRISVERSVDKTMNAIQNILLQELEDFEGIFMSTTNLADQLDKAFERRLLYKIQFKNPNPITRKKILENYFMGMSTNIIETLTRDYSLTGAQVSNIKKKLLIKEVMTTVHDKEECLIDLCKEEFILSTQQRPMIGFIQQ